MSRLLIGVTGGIAAYKAIETARLAVKAGHAVRVVQTPNSARFVGAESFAGITGAPVLSSEFDDDPLRGAYPGESVGARAPIAHLALVQRADVYLIAPASASTLAKLAGGHADSLVTTAALAADCPVIVAPAMNDRMYRHPATQANLATLAARGVTIVGPGEGELASHGERGVGRMSEPAELLAAVQSALSSGADDTRWSTAAWNDRRVLVSAGGTREPIDSVRYIGNRSSGRMGYALAARAAARGAQVTLVSANVSLPAPAGVRVVAVATAAELKDACETAFTDADVVLMAAAVADFRPRDPAAHKLKKDGGPPRLDLEPTADVLSGLAAQRRPGQVLVGFAAEHGDGALDYARDKLQRKGLDAIVVNDVSQAGIGFDAADNEVTVIAADGTETRLERDGKERIADGVLDRVETLMTMEERTPMSAEPAPLQPHESEASAAVARALQANIASAVQVRQDNLDHLIVALLAEGHVLVEDYPGVGKTALARALSRSIDCQFARVQGTSDLLPADVVGTNVYDQREQVFEFRPGPVFANIVLVDEINRASPKTQSGLLECMQERRVTVDGHTHELARPFVVIATQNPIEYEGTYPLPEAQVDRFMIRMSMGYPDRAAEAGMLAAHEAGDQVLALRPVATAAEVLAAQDAAARVRASPALRDYIVNLLWRTREDPRVDLGASPRAGLMLLRAAKAHAMMNGRDHALPDDVQALAAPVLAHRLALAPETPRSAARDVIHDAVSAIRAL